MLAVLTDHVILRITNIRPQCIGAILRYPRGIPDAASLENAVARYSRIALYLFDPSEVH